MRVNGQDILLDKPVCLKSFLEKSGYRLERIAVELNGTIVPKASYEEVMLTEADKLEVVSFVGGG